MRRQKHDRLLGLSTTLAAGGVDRTYQLAAVGIRSDGKMVSARNGSPMFPLVSSHAEARLSKKLTPGSIVFVARVLRSGETALAKPCKGCQALLKAAGVVTVFYTTDKGSACMRL